MVRHELDEQNMVKRELFKAKIQIIIANVVLFALALTILIFVL